jgi:protein arginine N-methyltransferase 7
MILIFACIARRDVLTILKSPASALTQGDLGGHRIGTLLSEPYFSSSLLPWHVRVAAPEVARRLVVLAHQRARRVFCFTYPLPQNLYFWYARTSVDHLLAEDAAIMPSSGRLMAVAVELKDLYKRYALAFQKTELLFS